MTLGLVGDVGGTNGRFALVDLEGVRKTHTWPTDQLPSLPAIAHHFGFRDRKPDFACIAVAAPVNGQTVTLTNANVRLDVGTLEVPRARLANDLEAAAAGVVDVPGSLRDVVVAGEHHPERPSLVVGLGTGLGVAIRMPDGQVISGEGGHAAYAPGRPTTMQLAMELSAQLGRPAEWEDVLCGRGFGRFVAWTRGQKRLAVSREFGALEALAHATTAEPDSEAHALFAEAVADFIRGLAFTVRAGEIFLCGGVSGHLRHLFHSDGFRSRLLVRGPVSHVLDGVPVTVVTDDQLALRGCIRLSQRWYAGD